MAKPPQLQDYGLRRIVSAMDFISIILLAVGCFNLWMAAMVAMKSNQERPDYWEAKGARYLGFGAFSVLNGTLGLLAGAALSRIGKRLPGLDPQEDYRQPADKNPAL